MNTPNSTVTANSWTAGATDLERGEPVAEGSLVNGLAMGAKATIGSVTGSAVGAVVGGMAGAAGGLGFALFYYTGQAILGAAEEDADYPKFPFKPLIVPAILGGGIISAGIGALSGVFAGQRN